MIWVNLHNVPSKDYTCGHCGNSIATDKGYAGPIAGSRNDAYIYICHKCRKPTFFDIDESQIPGFKIGSSVMHIPSKDVENLYEEARSCFSVNAFTSAVMCCRKILMSIAVAEGATEKKNFVYYVKYLNDNGHIPPNGKPWVDKIRDMGNEANHEIAFKNEPDAKLILTFTEMLLKFMYEMGGMMEEYSKIGVSEEEDEVGMKETKVKNTGGLPPLRKGKK